MFDGFHASLLSLLIWLPMLGGVIVLAIGRDDRNAHLIKVTGIAFAVVTFLLCIPLYAHFNVNDYHMQFVEKHEWIPALHIGYNLGVDGISALFIILTCFTNMIIIIAAWRPIKTKVAQFMAVFLFATGIMNGAFAATDAILFYIFWEASMIPMYIGIGVWGGKDRAYAAMKFFLFTFLGSVFMLVAFLFLYTKTGNFDIATFQNVHLTTKEDDWIFLAFLAAFAVKIPMWPVHTWLPNAHTAAPSGGSVILAALMLKMGAYGFLRFSLPITPGVSMSLDWLLIGLSLVAVVYIGFVAIVQEDMKQLIAYSSIAHMGLVTLGIFMVFMIVGETHNQVEAMVSVQGAVFQMIGHAFSSGGMFIGVGFLYERYHSHMLKDFSGVVHAMPIFASFFMLFAMANVGLPGTSGFVGEFMIILSAFKANIWVALLASTTLVLAPAYTLWMYKRVLFGQAKSEAMSKPNDITGSEMLVFSLLAICVIALGVYPEPVFNLSHATTAHFVEHVMSRIPAGAY